jgi:glycerol-3-phosphate dehydrogenase
LFVVPWVPNGDGTFQYTYIGTTDTSYDGSVDNPQCTKDDIDYVLRALNASITNEVTHKDVLAVWAGLRPLVKPDENEKIGERTADLSRRHRVSTSDSGVITVTGGKLTTYREMSEDTIDAVIHQLHLSNKKYRCRTKNLALHGSRGYRESKSRNAQQMHLAHRFGSYASDIDALIAAQPDLGLPLIDGLPYLRAEAMYAATHEMAYTLDDVLSRRTRALLFNRAATKNAARSVAELIAPQLQWSESDINNQVELFNAICAEEEAAGLVTESEFIAATKEQP